MQLFGKSITNRLAINSIKNSKNFFPIVSVILCSLLFTTLFSVSSNLYSAITKNEFKRLGTDNQITSKMITAKQYDLISKDTFIGTSGVSMIVGTVADRQLLKLPTEVRYADDYSAKHSFTYPQKGSMPKEKNEIATSSSVLNSYGIEPKIGTTLSISIKVDSKYVENSFTVVGIWEPDPVQSRQMLFVSKDFADEIVPKRTSNYILGTGTAGYFSAMFNLKKNGNITGTFKELQNKYPDINLTINPAYENTFTKNIDIRSIAAFLGCILLIFISAYLIIYNVFYISTANDIREYGLLKAIGGQSSQIRKIMNTKAVVYCLIGIPIGIALGVIFGYIITPFIAKNLTTVLDNSVSVTPLAIALAVIFSTLTVYLSMRKSAILASNISAIEAIQYVGKKNKPNKRFKKSKVNPARMARRYIKNDEKKFVMIVSSISLSLIVMNTTFNIVSSFDLNKLISNQMISDFRITDSSAITGAVNAEMRSIPQNVSKKVKTYSKISNFGEVYQQYIDQTFTKKQLSDAQQWGKEKGDTKISNFPKNYYAENRNGKIATEIYGINEYLASKVTVLEGTLSLDKFLSGEGVYVTPLRGELEGQHYSFYHPGDVVKLEYENNKYKSYTVLAVVTIPKGIHMPSYLKFGPEYVVSDSAFKQAYPKSLPISILFDTKQEDIGKIQEDLQNYLKSNSNGLGIESKETIKERYNSLVDMFEIVGYSLCMVLAIIGLLNFVNSVFSSILARKRELSILEAIGMTKKQILQMLCFEGIYYAFFSLILSFIIGLTIQFFFIRSLENVIYFMTWKVTVIPLIICILPIALMALIIPYVCYKKNLKMNLVDRLGSYE